LPRKAISETCSEQEIRAELARMVQSQPFINSERLARFLRFTVEAAIGGKADSLKEYVIGVEVYDRKPPYHPSQDSIVRTEARRLRSKLKEYYEAEGQTDPIFIYFRPGTYVPVFRRNETPADSPWPTALSSDEDFLAKGAGVPIAVLPFLDLSGGRLSRLCAQGLTDDIVHVFAATDGIRVVASTSIAQLNEGDPDIPSLAKRLGVHNIIEGTIREEGNRLRVTVNVLGSDGFQLSSHRFETEASEETLFQVQAEIATAFISRVRPEVSMIRRRRASAGTLIMSVYPLVMQAEKLLDEGSASDLQAALLKFTEAAGRAPRYARTLSGIARCHLELAVRGLSSTSASVSMAKEASLRAIELDPEMVDPHATLGSALAMQWDWQGAEKSFLRGLSLGTHTSALRDYALFLAARKRFDEASEYLGNAQRIDPFSYRQKAARAKFFHLTRRYSEAIRLWSGPLIHGPLPLEARFFLALMLVGLGDTANATQLVQDIRPAAGAQLAMMAGIAEVLALSGEVRAAEDIAKDLKLLAPDSQLCKYRQALLAVAFGDGKRSLDLLRTALKMREPELVWIGVEPRFDPLRTESDFEAVVANVTPRS
jgi:TolB-like protein/tetratricopeptide (TPR) repeat protein